MNLQIQVPCTPSLMLCSILQLLRDFPPLICRLRELARFVHKGTGDDSISETRADPDFLLPPAIFGSHNTHRDWCVSRIGIRGWAELARCRVGKRKIRAALSIRKQLRNDLN